MTFIMATIILEFIFISLVLYVNTEKITNYSNIILSVCLCNSQNILSDPFRMYHMLF